MAKHPAAQAAPAAPGAPASPDAAPSGGPQIPPPPWQRTPERPSRRRRDPISRDAIVTAASSCSTARA